MKPEDLCVQELYTGMTEEQKECFLRYMHDMCQEYFKNGYGKGRSNALWGGVLVIGIALSMINAVGIVKDIKQIIDLKKQQKKSKKVE